MLSERLQEFFESTSGQFFCVGAILLLFTAIFLSDKGKKPDITAMTISAILVALSIALNQIILFRMPQGGSITAFSLLPITICGYFLGARRGILAGCCVGLMDLIFNPYVIHPMQMLLDYPLAFGALGLSGIFSKKSNRLIPAYLCGVLGKYFCAVLSGVIFFGAYVPEGFNAITWSLWYNLTYLGVEVIITVAILLLPPVKNTLEKLKGQL